MAHVDLPCAVCCHGLQPISLSGLGLAQGDEGKLPVLLVDGYNVLNACWKLRGSAEACHKNLEDEREQLVNDTRDYALSLSCRSIVVFDAMASRNSQGTPRQVPAVITQPCASPRCPKVCERQAATCQGKIRSATCCAEEVWHRDVLLAAAAMHDWAVSKHVFYGTQLWAWSATHQGDTSRCLHYGRGQDIYEGRVLHTAVSRSPKLVALLSYKQGSILQTEET